jgi:hypothetical protein
MPLRRWSSLQVSHSAAGVLLPPGEVKSPQARGKLAAGGGMQLIGTAFAAHGLLHGPGGHPPPAGGT